MGWNHPTGKAPKVVTLVCLGPSCREYVNAGLEPDLSAAILGAEETWTLNRGGIPFRHDLLFVMDHLQGEADLNPQYGAALWSHNRPIITSDNAAGWPEQVHLYPFLEVLQWLAEAVKPIHGDWFHNSLAYILCYAAFIGVKELRVFGADYTNHGSGLAVENGHPCVAYWVGALERAGLKVLSAEKSGFLNVHRRDWIYGYQTDPRPEARNRRRAFQTLIGKKSDPELYRGERQVASVLSGIATNHVARYRWATGRFATNQRVLDLGCGCGYGTALLAADHPSAIGVDKSGSAIRYAQKHWANGTSAFLCLDLEKDPLPDAEVIVAFEILEHVDAEVVLARLPKSATRLLASVPNQTAFPWSPEAAPFHRRHYTKAEFEALLFAAGWTVSAGFGQVGLEPEILPFHEGCRTIIVDATRKD